ncbi:MULTISPECIES: type 1 glutamine amidotransferase domain-containing protein [Pasteurellaceae]|uniref:Type 1 glutamine amidotransferase domain-containing protein n=1 Tax=Rodentibacter genomosp. 1 TaxID=1908264 RepID=A0A1V3J7I2_9PAST|nr:type 1 glutamine amidotransferase domain-containing protein [Rodentibacter genomosp. 1]MBF0750931.1 type 1 glutamine amidotransferase domain-containing protein [Pasteurella sp. 19428wF3_WM03]OOF51234.1 type 1 glutamine amidotransferase domain-containing protein [Rodentibacter genomosp. 1]TFU53191.1 type 1 glutamine amidotransferase domain-containing protein [Pasteurella sp. WM03]
MTKPILCVVTSTTEKGNTGISTGFWLSELTHPLKVMEEAGFKTVIASIKGGQAPIDKDSLDFTDPVNQYFWNETDLEARLAHTPSVSELNGEDYSAIFFAGGHGTMWDYRENQDAQRLIREVYENNGVVSAVCHGPAALVDAKLSNGEYLVKGKNVAAFTNKEEEEVGGTAIVPYLLESALIEHGAIHHEAPNWFENVYVDGRLVTGQNPASAHKVGVEVVKVLKG